LEALQIGRGQNRNYLVPYQSRGHRGGLIKSKKQKKEAIRQHKREQHTEPSKQTTYRCLVTNPFGGKVKKKGIPGGACINFLESKAECISSPAKNEISGENHGNQGAGAGDGCDESQERPAGTTSSGSNALGNVSITTSGRNIVVTATASADSDRGKSGRTKLFLEV